MITYDNYKDFIQNQLSRSKIKRGELTQIAQLLGVSNSMLSHILRGPKDLTFEQAEKLCRYWALDEMETEYFITTLQIERAGTENLKAHFRRLKTRIERRAQNLQDRLPHAAALTEEQKSTFYCCWIYSAVRQITAINGHHSVQEIAKALGLSVANVRKTIDFLLQAGLLQQEKEGFSPGPSFIHLSADSLQIGAHHRNWRIKALERADAVSGEELMYTGPMTLSREDFKKVRGKIMQVIEETHRAIQSSPSETFAILNIDLLRLV